VSPPFSFNATAPTPTYTLSLHDALPICLQRRRRNRRLLRGVQRLVGRRREEAPLLLVVRSEDHPLLVVLAHVDDGRERPPDHVRSEEHTSELQSRGHLVCRLLLEKKKQ